MSVQVNEVRGLGPIIVIVLFQEPLHVLYLRLRQLFDIALPVFKIFIINNST